MKINISEKRILLACVIAIGNLNDLIMFNHGLIGKEQLRERLEGQEIQREPQDIVRECEEKRKPYYLIQAKVKDGKELTEEDFNVLKRYL